MGSPSLASVMDLLLDAICVVDPQGRFVFVSAASERIFGYTAEEMIGRLMIDLVFHEDRARTLNAVDEIVEGRHKPHFENRYVRKDGRIVHIMWSARWSEADQVRVAVARDVTERKRAESMQAALYAISEAAHSSEDLVALFERIHQIIGSLLPAINFFVTLYDENQDELTFPYHVDEYNLAPPPQRLDSGMLSAEVIRTGRPLFLTRDRTKVLLEHVRPDVGGDVLDWLGVPLSGKNRVLGALVVKSYSDDARYTEQDMELLHFVSTQVAAAIERKQTETWLHHIARHDPLTDLPNRELFHEHLMAALALARRDQTRLSLLYLDLDTFKQVNDAWGHASACVHRIRSDALVAMSFWCCLTALACPRTLCWLPKSSALPWVSRLTWLVTGYPSQRALASPSIRSMATIRSNWFGTPTRRCTRPRSPAGTGATWRPGKAPR